MAAGDLMRRLIRDLEASRAGRFSASVPPRQSTRRVVCLDCRASRPADWQKMIRWGDGWTLIYVEKEAFWQRRNRFTGAREREPYDPTPLPCPECGGQLVEIDG